jgi:hypothetical protein
MEGVFLARLRLLHPDNSVDFHYVVYDGSTGRVLDNQRGGKVPVVENDDRKDNHAAGKVFAMLFPKAKQITLCAVLRGHRDEQS